MKEVFEKIINYIHSEIKRTSTYSEHHTQINIENYVKQLQEEYKSTEHINCSTDDLISRSALLGAMDKRYKEKEGNVLDNLAEGFMQMEKLIKEQPTVSVNDGWIPCSERLPEEPENGIEYMENLLEYNVMIKGASMATTLHYAGDGEWYDSMSQDYYTVVAWRPLPEPYQPKGE